MKGDIKDETFCSHEVNLSAYARKAKITETEGWKIFEKQRTCKHKLTTFVFGMFSYAEICTKCGYFSIDRGEPEL